MILSIYNDKPNRVVALFNNDKKNKNQINNFSKEKTNEEKKTIDNNYQSSSQIVKSIIKKKSPKEKTIVEKISDSTKEEIEEKKEGNQTITYTVLSPTNEVIYNKEITCKEPITVEQLLLNSGLEINNSSGFIESINGISNEGMSGWIFEVNNAPVMVSAADYIINPNEQITWKYINFSKMNIEEQTEEKNSRIVKKRIPQNKEKVNINN